MSLVVMPHVGQVARFSNWSWSGVGASLALASSSISIKNLMASIFEEDGMLLTVSNFVLSGLSLSNVPCLSSVILFDVVGVSGCSPLLMLKLLPSLSAVRRRLPLESQAIATGNDKYSTMDVIMENVK